jgi:extradiol dioxygenase family protein
MTPRFHLAFPVDDLAAARGFYGGILGCGEGRSAATWIDFDFHGHQLVAHLAPGASLHRSAPGAALHRNAVDGDQVPVPHFGLVLGWREWEGLRDRLIAAGSRFEIAPHIRFPGQPGEQATMFLFDPAGNALEFKAFKDIEQLFAR